MVKGPFPQKVANILAVIAGGSISALATLILIHRTDKESK